ncbi:MAG TPA: biotin/lipoyl-containing protein [Candidatus Nitrosopolaris sp.]|nr:biotin/lipoyl-containing protein [Candidatus Nitrosopolaris sp.]
MKIEVNGTMYDIEHVGEKVWVNNKELMIKLNKDKIIIEGNAFYVDFVEDGEPSLMIINGVAYLVSKISLTNESIKEIKIPISGKITDVFVRAGSEVREGSVLAALQAMKMENQIKSPRSGKIKEIKVSKDQSVKTGEILVTFE